MLAEIFGLLLVGAFVCYVLPVLLIVVLLLLGAEVIIGGR